MTYNGEDKYTLTSGRTFSANCGVIGLSPELEAKEGWDGPTYLEDGYDPVTPDERREIADMMIARWTAWAAKRPV